jgi:hypothetical protein
VACREQNDAFPEYPEEEDGGSVFIFDPPPPKEEEEGDGEGEGDAKGKTGDKKGDTGKKGGDKKKDGKKGKKGEEEEEEKPAELPVSPFVLKMQVAEAPSRPSPFPTLQFAFTLRFHERLPRRLE